MKPKCQECGEEFYGRADKKFCSAECRISYHNRENRDKNNFMRNVNRMLRMNRQVLDELNSEGKTNIHKDKLLAKGFNFNYFTSEYITRAGKVYRYVYDQGYTYLGNDYYMLVIKKEYTE
jgi:predicted nucleic acid-binding Zn ribbon protein